MNNLIEKWQKCFVILMVVSGSIIVGIMIAAIIKLLIETGYWYFIFPLIFFLSAAGMVSLELFKQ